MGEKLKKPLRPLPTWLKWVLRLFGAIFTLAALWFLALLALAIWVMAHSDVSKSPKFGEVIAGTLGQLVGAVLILLLGIWMIRRTLAKDKPQEIVAVPVENEAAPITAVVESKPVPRKIATRLHSANVLDLGVHSRHLWQFSVHDGKFNVARDQSLSPTEKPSENLVAKSWSSLWQPKLNVAWLPADKVFLRVMRLPASDFAEILSMVELQLEKISPLPTAQVVWSVELLPKRAEDALQTAIVVIVARNVVEEFLGELEGQGFLADRLELPLMDELLATQAHEDGVWVYPGVTTASPYLVAWWYAGILENVTLFSPAPGQDLGVLLRQQISQIAWAGELEGWLTSPPRLHLVADGETAAVWEPTLNQVADQPVQLTDSVPQAQLAAMSAKRSVYANGTANLVPVEYTTRYRQQFVDRLWMRGLGAVAALYLIGLVIYFGALQVLNFQRSRMDSQVRAISGSYTNALKMEARIHVLEDRKNLQFAALDSWKAVAEILPENVSIDSMVFQRGKTFDLRGTVPQEDEGEVTDFNQAMRRVKNANGDLIFSEVSTPRSSIRGSSVEWTFSCKLKNGEE